MSGEGATSNETVVRGAAHYNEIAAQAWKERAERAEARVRELEALLAAMRDRPDASKRSGQSEPPAVPGGLPTPPGTQFYRAGEKK